MFRKILYKRRNRNFTSTRRQIISLNCRVLIFFFLLLNLCSYSYSANGPKLLRTICVPQTFKYTILRLQTLISRYPSSCTKYHYCVLVSEYHRCKISSAN